METDTKTRHKVHRILAHSYAVYLTFFLVGVVLDMIFDFRVFSSLITIPLGAIFLGLGTLLIFWAQRTSHKVLKEDITKEIFHRGPYMYTSSPTHWGLFFLILGFGIISNALFVILFTLFSFLVTRWIFLDKHEKAMEEKYGDHYRDYKKSTKF